jgi:uncharacterized Tic20 family protein
MTEREKPSGLLLKIADNPLIVLIGLIISIIALILMVALYIIDQKERELVYAINPIKTQVVTMGEFTGLEIIHNGIALGNTDVTAVQIAIWNSGDLSIRSENILKEVAICTDPPVQILEVSIVKNYREYDVTEFRTLDTEETLKNGRVPVTWRILERNDGASIQLIYLGSIDVDIYVDGLIEGGGAVNRVESGITIKSPTEQFKSEQKLRWFFIVYAGLLIIFVIPFFIWEVRRKFKSDDSKRKKRIDIILSILLLLVGITGAVLLLSSVFRYSGPPFGF